MFKTKNIIPILIIFFFGFLCGSLVYREYFKQKFSVSNYALIEKISEIDFLLEDEYIYTGNINNKEMNDQAISAYVKQKKDPYLTYFSPKIHSGFITLLKGNQGFSGIGAVIVKKDDYIFIEEVLKKSPSAEAGIIALDHILEIDGVSVKNMDIDDVVKKLRGETGTKVKLLIYREKGFSENKQTQEIVVTRKKIDLPSAYTEVLTGKDNKQILYVQLILIGEETDALLKQQLAKIKKQEIDGIIIDVRGNAGGYMNVAVDIASHFISKGSLVTSAKYRAYPEEKYYTKQGPFFMNKDIIVLVDGETASAGEIIALGLQELGNARLLGEKTFGKGTIQTMYDFSDKSSLKYTIGKRYSPSGLSIDHKGITPDIEIEFDIENYINKGQDNQLQKALELL